VTYENFLPLNNALEFKVPIVKAYSYSSNLYHEKMIENIFRTTLNKLAYRYNEQKGDGDMRLKINEESEEILKEKIEKRKLCN
jgi:hypothetical protein